MKALRKPLSLFMALLMCLGVFVGTGTTAFAAGETMTTYMIDLPRASDPNKAGWGHPALNFLGGWSTGANDSFSVHTQDAFNGRAIYCIEPGVGVNTGDQYTPSLFRGNDCSYGGTRSSSIWSEPVYQRKGSDRCAQAYLRID